MPQRRLSDILDRAIHGFSPSREDVVQLLSLKDSASIQLVMSAAQKVRQQYFGDWLFLYGFIYLSTYCRIIALFVFIEKPIHKARVTAKA